METISDVIIHLGAGLGTSAPLYQQLGYKQLVLVETSAELVKLLSKKFAHQQNAHIKNVAISAQDEHIEFNNYSNPRYGSQLALEPEFINNSNLHMQEKKQIPAINLAQLSAELKLTDTQYNTLIIELNGYEAQFLTMLPLAQLAIFSKIIVSLQATARYVDQTNEPALSTVLAANGFSLTATESNQYIYEKDEQLIAILQTQAQQAVLIEKLQNECDALTQENKEWAEALQHEATTLKQQLQQQQLNANNNLETHKQELAKTAKELLRITKERDEQAHWNQKNKEWAEALQHEATTLKQQLQQQQLDSNNNLETQKQELAKTTEERDEQTHWNQKNKEWAEALQQETATLKQQLEQQQLDASKFIEEQKQKIIIITEELQLATKARDEQAHWNQKNKEWAEAQQQEIATLKQHFEQQQLDASKFIEEQKQKIITITEELQLVTKERDEQAHWHQKNKLWAEALQQETVTIKQQLEQQQLNENKCIEMQKLEITKATEELHRITKERDEQAHWNQKHKDWAESLNRDIEALKKDYAEGERAQSLALKLQAKAQVDLEHLRTQYQQKLKQEQKLIELIQELQLKLQAAANYYHQLQLQHPELSAERNQSNADNAIDAEIISKPIEPKESKNAHKKHK